MRGLFLILIFLSSFHYPLAQDSTGQMDSMRNEAIQEFHQKWVKIPFYQDSLMVDSFLSTQFPFQQSYNSPPIPRNDAYGTPVLRIQDNHVWRFWIVLVLMACIGLVRVISPGVIVSYFQAFIRPKLMSEILEEQRSEISSVSILMSFFTSLMYALPGQWILWMYDAAMTDYPFGDYLLLVVIIFTFIIFRFMWSSMLGRIFEAEYFVATSIYSSVCLNFFSAAIAVPFFFIMLLNTTFMDGEMLRILLFTGLISMVFLKSLKAFTHSISRYAYPTFYLIVYLCASEIIPWVWTYILVYK